MYSAPAIMANVDESIAFNSMTLGANGHSIIVNAVEPCSSIAAHLSPCNFDALMIMGQQASPTTTRW